MLQPAGCQQQDSIAGGPCRRSSAPATCHLPPATCCWRCPGHLHPRGLPRAREGKKPVREPGGRDGGRGLLALLQGKAGDSSSDGSAAAATAGRRAVSAPTDNKRDVSFGQLLAQTAPACPDADAWIGHISIDPAKGKGWAPDPSQGRGADLFDVLQQRVLQQPPGGTGSQAVVANADAWIGNR